MKKYSWDFDIEAEYWKNDPCDTVTECICAARQVVAAEDYETDEPPEIVYIGENEPFIPRVRPESVLEEIKEYAADFAGEIGEDWENCNPEKNEELNELGDALTFTVIKWMKKYGYKPTFYNVLKAKPYRL